MEIKVPFYVNKMLEKDFNNLAGVQYSFETANQWSKLKILILEGKWSGREKDLGYLLVATIIMKLDTHLNDQSDQPKSVTYTYDDCICLF